MKPRRVKTHFSHYFNVPDESLENHGAFNISLIQDLPLFIDPFLLFNSNKPDYQQLHAEIIQYLRFLRGKSQSGGVQPGLVAAWYSFPEVKQTWLGFSKGGNSGRGLGAGFAVSLNRNLHTIFSSFGGEDVTQGSHFEKLTLVEERVGKDKISDFTTGLIKGYLLQYTQEFAASNLSQVQLREVSVPRSRFDYETETWVAERYELPWFVDDFVILTPKDMLTREDTWINKSDLVGGFDEILQALPNEVLRAQLNNYLAKILPDDPTADEKRGGVVKAIREFPEVIEYYILQKENRGELAVSYSEQRVAWSESLFVENASDLAGRLHSLTAFYTVPGNTLDEARERAKYLKDVIENKGGWRLLYIDGSPIRREEDLQIMYRLTWIGTESDVSREVNDGRGPADYKISRGSKDKTIVEFKLARNTRLRRNLERQAEIYKKASDADKDLKVITYFTKEEYDRVVGVLRDLAIEGSPRVVLIDARSDNKPSASRA